MLDFPNNPQVNDVFNQWKWDGVRWNVAPPPPPPQVTPQCGRLIFADSTHVRFVPYNGNQIQINAQIVTIPDQGVDLEIGWMGDMNYIYAAAPGGNLYLFNSSRGHRYDNYTPGNIGIEIMDFPTNLAQGSMNTLVGMVYADNAAETSDTPAKRHVASWFNRQEVSIEAGTETVYMQPPPTPTIDPTVTASFLTWAENNVRIEPSYGFASMGDNTPICLGWTIYDGVTTNVIGRPQRWRLDPFGAISINPVFMGDLTEGKHTAANVFQKVDIDYLVTSMISGYSNVLI